MAQDNSSSMPSALDIQTALSRTGFLLEYRVARSLRERGFDVDISRAYPDPTTGKSREIDVFANLDCQIGDANIIVIADLIIECKNSSSPFVLIGDHGGDYAHMDESTILTFDPLQLQFYKAPSSSLEIELKLDHLPGSPLQGDFTGYQLLRLTRHGGTWKADNNAIYDGILYPLAKAWRYQIKERRSELDDKDIKAWEYKALFYIFPIVVTSGKVFTVDVTGQEAEITEAKWAKIKRSFSSNELSGDLRADIVSFDHLNEYLDSRVLKVVKSAEAVLTKNIHLYDPEWLAANLGKPRRSQNRDFFEIWLSDVQIKKGGQKS